MTTFEWLWEFNGKCLGMDGGRLTWVEFTDPQRLSAPSKECIMRRAKSYGLMIGEPREHGYADGE